MGGIFRKVAVGALGAQTQNASCLETSFTGNTAFHCCSLSTPNNGLPNTSRSRFQANVIKVNLI
jgi:hypothetical protein